MPAGVHSGQSISLRGKGEAGIRAERGGDLVVTIQVEEHGRFERQGDDLFCRVEIDSLEAIVGMTLTVPGILDEEVVEVRVPAGCSFGEQVKVTGYGMPRLGSHARGSLIAVVQVSAPQGLTKRQLGAIREIVGERRAGRASESQVGDEGNVGAKRRGFRGRKRR